MALNFDEHALDIPCPHCGNKIQEKIGRLKTDPEITCPACAMSFTIDATEFRSGVAEAEKSLSSFLTGIGRMFK
jgi:DNA-directed RNA polymerase subunit RPC12/RpoP